MPNPTEPAPIQHQPQGGPEEVTGEYFTEMVKKMLAAPPRPAPPRKSKKKPLK